MFTLWPLYRLAALFNISGASEFYESRRTGAVALTRYLKNSTATQPAPIWLHGASVGEIDQALALAREIKTRQPERPILLSAFSMSVRLREFPEVDLFFYLPLDFPGSWRDLQHGQRPSAFITMTWDVFPNLIYRLSKLNIPAFICSASIGADNRRLRFPFRRLVRSLYDALAGIGAVNVETQTLFQQLTQNKERVAVTGDTRFDTIFYKLRSADLPVAEKVRFQALQTAANKASGGIWILASTYAADDRELLPAMARLLQQYVGWKVLIFPHKLDERRLHELETGLKDLHLSPVRLDAARADTDRVIIVDRMGLLALAYRYADFCYVGGAFHHRIHNVAEPAALGLPVITGPRIDWAGVAVELKQRGGLRRCRQGLEIYGVAQQWMQSADERRRAGQIAADYLLSEAGASRRFYDRFLDGLLNE